jgi:hypothetical protein
MNTHEALDVLQRQTVFFSEVQEVHVSKAREAFLAEARLHVRRLASLCTKASSRPTPTSSYWRAAGGLSARLTTRRS